MNRKRASGPNLLWPAPEASPAGDRALADSPTCGSGAGESVQGPDAGRVATLAARLRADLGPEAAAALALRLRAERPEVVEAALRELAPRRPVTGQSIYERQSGLTTLGD